jgi:hypothetical protein
VFEVAAALEVSPSTEGKADCVTRALRGGYPEAVRRVDLGRRARFFEVHLSDLINRDVRLVSHIERPGDPAGGLTLGVFVSSPGLCVPGDAGGGPARDGWSRLGPSLL